MLFIIRLFFIYVCLRVFDYSSVVSLYLACYFVVQPIVKRGLDGPPLPYILYGSLLSNSAKLAIS